MELSSSLILYSTTGKGKINCKYRLYKKMNSYFRIETIIYERRNKHNHHDIKVGDGCHEKGFRRLILINRLSVVYGVVLSNKDTILQ